MIYFPGQPGSDSLIGINGQNPVAGGFFQCPLFLNPKPWPVGNFRNVGVLLCNLNGAVGTAAVQNDNLIGDLPCRQQAVCDVVFLVLGNDSCRYLNGAATGVRSGKLVKECGGDCANAHQIKSQEQAPVECGFCQAKNQVARRDHRTCDTQVSDGG